MSEFKDRTLKALRQLTNNSNIKLPEHIEIDQNMNGTTKITLTQKAAGITEHGDACNMQEPEAAFEGWAIALRGWCRQYDRLKWNGDIELDVAGELPSYTVMNGQYNRFLYRALCFHQDYPWFDLSDKLNEKVEEFSEYLLHNLFINNVPSNEAGENGGIENQVETWFETPNTFKEMIKDQIHDISDKIYRQLPCGLFEKEVSDKNKVFTGKKSAIDFWNYSKINEKSVMTIVELKAKNRMIGLITEIFFYAHFCKDFFSSNENREKFCGKFS